MECLGRRGKGRKMEGDSEERAMRSRETCGGERRLETNWGLKANPDGAKKKIRSEEIEEKM